MPSGSCICGAITYSFDGQPSAKALCHCLTCRKITSSAAGMTALILSSNFRSNADSVTSYKQNTVTHETGVKLIYSFCGDCATTLWKVAPDGWPGHHIIFTGTLDGDAFEELKPDMEFWVKYRAPWMESLERTGVAQLEGFPPH